MFPNLICPGAAKSGTTTLYDLLKQHPDVLMSSKKETNFFVQNYQLGGEWYKKTYFSGWKGEKIIGDITPSYMSFKYVAKRIFDMLGNDIKLIFLLRNPVTRAYSHYWMTRRNGLENKSFEDALLLEEERIRREEYNIIRFGYVQRGLYAEQIKEYLKHFRYENMRFILFEDFICDTKKEMQNIFNFLGINDYSKIDYSKKSNPAQMPIIKPFRKIIVNPDIRLKLFLKKIFWSKNIRRWTANLTKRIEDKINNRRIDMPQIKEETKEKLKKIFFNDIKQLEKIIKRDLHLWLEA